MIMQFYQIWRW